MRIRAVVAAVVVLGSLFAGPVRSDAAAPPGSGITAETSSPTTGLDGGETIVVEVSGLTAGQEFRLGLCAEDNAATCSGDPYTAGADGALTVPFRVSNWTFLVPPTGQPQIEGCRSPGACSLIAWRLGGTGVAEEDSIPLTYIGSQIEATFTPTTDLADGQAVLITGRSGAAAGRTVEVRQIACLQFSCLVDEVLGFTVIQSDDTFSLTVNVTRTPPRNGGGTFNCAAPTDGVEACQLFAFVAEDDGSQDESREKAAADLSFRDSFQVRIGATQVTEGTGGARRAFVPLRLTSAQTGPVWVTVRTINGAAWAPSDFAFTKVTVRFSAGQTLARVPVPIVTDSRNEPNERFYVRGLNVTGGGGFAWPSASVLILDDD